MSWIFIKTRNNWLGNIKVKSISMISMKCIFLLPFCNKFILYKSGHAPTTFFTVIEVTIHVPVTGYFFIFTCIRLYLKISVCHYDKYMHYSCIYITCVWLTRSQQEVSDYTQVIVWPSMNVVYVCLNFHHLICIVLIY